MTGRRLLVSWVVSALILCATSPAFAQQNHPILDAPGFQPNRDYFSEQSFEHIDTLGGALILTFTDLVLPGDAGRELRFQRTYNSKTGSWKFGVAGLAVRISDPNRPSFEMEHPLFQQLTPALHIFDGGVRTMAWVVPPSHSTESTTDFAVTSNFWKLNRDTRVLSMPDGFNCTYESAGANLLRIDYCDDLFDNNIDAFPHDVDFAWGSSNDQPPVPQQPDTGHAPGFGGRMELRL
jgi:hypothetical protein